MDDEVPTFANNSNEILFPPRRERNTGNDSNPMTRHEVDRAEQGSLTYGKTPKELDIVVRLVSSVAFPLSYTKKKHFTIALGHGTDGIKAHNGLASCNQVNSIHSSRLVAAMISNLG